MIKLSLSLQQAFKWAAEQPAPAPTVMPPAATDIKPAPYKRTASPFAAFHAHGKALGALEFAGKPKKQASSVTPAQSALADDPTAKAEALRSLAQETDAGGVLGPNTKHIPAGAAVGAALGIPGGLLYNALAGDDHSASSYLMAALKGGLLGGGAGALSSGVLGYPYMPPDEGLLAKYKNIIGG